jgi:hypothetical protein
VDCPLLSSIYYLFFPLLLYVLYGPDFFVAIRIAIVDLTIKWGLWFQQFNNTTFLCLSKERTWIANTICHGLCFSSMIWGERWLVLLILVELLNITVSTFFSSITKIYINIKMFKITYCRDQSLWPLTIIILKVSLVVCCSNLQKGR